MSLIAGTARMALAAVLATVLAAPASAATFRIQAGGGSGGGSCDVFDVTSSAALVATAGCGGGPNGATNGEATAGFGYVGVAAGAFAASPQPIDFFTVATYVDTVTFTSTNPADTQALVAFNLVLDGLLANAGPSQPRLEGAGYFGGAQFQFVLQRTASTNTSLDGLSLVGGVLNNDIGQTFALLRTPTVVVPLGTPVEFSLTLKAATFARENGSFGTVDFANTFEAPIGSDVFVLPQGVTANSGTWLVNNRRIDPDAVAVPEPATWALMIGGFGMAGGRLRRQRAEATT